MLKNTHEVIQSKSIWQPKSIWQSKSVGQPKSIWQRKSRLLAGLALVCAIVLPGRWGAMTATVPAAEAANAAGSALLSDARLDASSSSFSQNGGGAG